MEFNNSLVTLQPGMYLLRHPQRGMPPLSVTRAPGSPQHSGRLETLATPKTGGSILRDGSDCIVMQVLDAPVDLLVTAFLNNASDPVPSIRIDRIGLEDGTRAAGRPGVAGAARRTAPGPAAPDSAAALDSAAAAAAATSARAAPAAAAKSKRPITIPNKGVSIIAHIERKGDVVGHDGMLVGDPATALRVEGFQLMWPDRPAGVDIAYNIAVEGLGALPTVQTGKFCGTRGQARRITELTLALVGAQAGEYQLEGTAHFSGGFQVPVQSGRLISGPSGLEHLTALCLRTVKSSPAPKPALNPWDDSATTKVFKAPLKGAPATSRSAATKKTTARTAKADQA